MRRRAVAPFALLALAAIAMPPDAGAHAGPRQSDPAAGATLGATPQVIRLTFSERPDPALSSIRVLDTGGAAFHAGRPEPLAGDPLSLAVGVRPLPRGVYTVSWRIVSAVDGHATAGSYVFGVGVSPSGASGVATIVQEPSRLEVLARWILIAGLVTMIGAAAGAAARFGGPTDVALAALGWAAAAAGLVLLALAQARNADVPLGDLAGSAIGRALAARAAAIAAAAIALMLAAGRAKLRRGGLMAAGVWTLVAMAVHSASGHAGAGRGADAMIAIASQWVHIAAAGIWLGGLAALLLGTRGAPSADKAAAVARFSTIAAAGLAAVVATGAIRTFDELTSWRDLFGNAYGQGVLAKMTLAAAIAGAAAFNRRWSVPRAAATLAPLRRAGGVELALTVLALGAAAWMGTLPPPASGLAAPREIVVSGEDFGTTVRATLTIASDAPGPNRFTLRAADYDSGDPLQARRVSLRFVPPDDPGVAATSLDLARDDDGTYTGTGANLAFDGRWTITALIERSGDAVEIPLAVEVQGPSHLLSIERPPGAPPAYTIEILRTGFIRISPDPEQPGRSTLTISCFDVIMEPRPVETIAVIATAEDGEPRRLPVRSADRIHFTADAHLHPGRNTFTIVARTVDGTRLRGAVTIDVIPKS